VSLVVPLLPGVGRSNQPAVAGHRPLPVNERAVR